MAKELCSQLFFSSKTKYTDIDLVYRDFMFKRSKQLWWLMDVFKNAVLSRKTQCLPPSPPLFHVALHNQYNFLFLVSTCTKHHRKHYWKGPWEVMQSSLYPRAGSVLPALVLKDVWSVFKDSLWRARGHYHCCLLQGSKIFTVKFLQMSNLNLPCCN